MYSIVAKQLEKQWSSSIKNNFNEALKLYKTLNVKYIFSLKHKAPS